MNEKHFRKNAPKNLYLVTTDDGWKDPRAKPGSASQLRPEHTMYKGEALEKVTGKIVNEKLLVVRFQFIRSAII